MSKKPGFLDMILAKTALDGWKDWANPPVRWMDLGLNQKVFNCVVYLLNPSPRTTEEYKDWLDQIEAVVEKGTWAEKEAALNLCMRFEIKLGQSLPPKLPDRVISKIGNYHNRVPKVRVRTFRRNTCLQPNKTHIPVDMG